MSREDRVALAERAVELFLQGQAAKGEPYSAKDMAEVVVDALDGAQPPAGQVQ